MAKSTSASEVDQPRLSRTAPWAISGPNPMASSTCEGCTLPEEQAEPEDTAIPARSKPITAVSALRPGTVNSVVLGSRGAPSENTMAPGVSRRPLSSRFRSPPSRMASSSRLSRAALTAAPNPTIPVTFSVPARRPRSPRPHTGPNPDNPRYVLGPRPPAQLLAAAAQQRLQPGEPLRQHQGP